MMRPWAIVKGVAKLALWTVTVLVALVALWFIVNRWFDESPNPQRDAFLVSASDQLSDEANIAIGILGLTAPRGQDFVQYGAKVKSLHRANAPWPEVQQMLRGPNTLQATTESQQVNCWLDPNGPQMKGCLPFDQAPAVLAENKELLERYKHLHRMTAYSGLGWSYNQAYLSVAKLAVAEMHVDLRKGDAATAYRKWRDQVVFARKTLRGPDTWVGKAVGLVAIGMSLPVLEAILLADSKLAKQHSSELKTLLKPDGIKGFNPEGIVRAEYVVLRNAFESEPQHVGDWPVDRLHWLAYHFGQNERILNRYYFFARDYAAILSLPWPQFEKEVQRLRQTFDYPSAWDISIDPFGSLFFANYVEGQLKTREMIRQMHIIDGRLRLSTLLVRIIDESIADTSIAQFLESVGPEFFDPFSGKPMRWDSKERKIYFPDPEYPCAMYASMRVPPQQGRSAAASQTGEKKC